MPNQEKILQQQVITALIEDIGSGDITSLAVVDESLTGVAEIIAKSDGILCGLLLTEYTFLKVDPQIEFQALVKEGSPFRRGDRVALVKGHLRSILIGERTALNFLGHLSGIATLTHKMVETAASDRVKILYTRKTTPGLRYLEKYAVATGGGENHRFGLFDMILIKDNHIAAAGSVSAAIKKARDFLVSENFLKIFHTDPSSIEIEVEVETEAQLQEALESGIKRILLDNRSPEHLTKMVQMARRHPQNAGVILEASGNVTLENIKEIAQTGVDYISIGALTHSAPTSDFSLKLLEDE